MLPLKLLTYGAVQMLLLLFFKDHQHKAAGMKINKEDILCLICHLLGKVKDNCVEL